jgi:hypothetical protein
MVRGLRGRLRSEAVVSPSAARPFLVLLAVVIFALSLERAGLVLSTVLLTASAALAGRDLRKHEFATLAVILTAVSVAVFLWGLGLPLRLWPVLALSSIVR